MGTSQSELARGGFNSIPRGQFEASIAELDRILANTTCGAGAENTGIAEFYDPATILHGFRKCPEFVEAIVPEILLKAQLYAVPECNALGAQRVLSPMYCSKLWKINSDNLQTDDGLARHYTQKDLGAAAMENRNGGRKWHAVWYSGMSIIKQFRVLGLHRDAHNRPYFRQEPTDRARRWQAGEYQTEQPDPEIWALERMPAGMYLVDLAPARVYEPHGNNDPDEPPELSRGQTPVRIAMLSEVLIAMRERDFFVQKENSGVYDRLAYIRKPDWPYGLRIGTGSRGLYIEPVENSSYYGLYVMKLPPTRPA